MYNLTWASLFIFFLSISLQLDGLVLRSSPVPIATMTAPMSTSAVGSEVFSLVALVVLSALVLLILRYYLPLRTTPAFVLVTVFFALWLPAAIVLLVPIDLASGAQTEDEASRGIHLPERVIHTCWRVVYWLIFVLTWYAHHFAGDSIATMPG